MTRLNPPEGAAEQRIFFRSENQRSIVGAYSSLERKDGVPDFTARRLA
jgi:hypothetical protein